MRESLNRVALRMDRHILGRRSRSLVPTSAALPFCILHFAFCIIHYSPLTSHLSPLTSHLSPLTSHLSLLASFLFPRCNPPQNGLPPLRFRAVVHDLLHGG